MKTQLPCYEHPDPTPHEDPAPLWGPSPLWGLSTPMRTQPPWGSSSISERSLHYDQALLWEPSPHEDLAPYEDPATHEAPASLPEPSLKWGPSPPMRIQLPFYEDPIPLWDPPPPPSPMRTQLPFYVNRGTPCEDPVPILWRPSSFSMKTIIFRIMLKLFCYGISFQNLLLPLNQR